MAGKKCEREKKTRVTKGKTKRKNYLYMRMSERIMFLGMHFKFIKFAFASLFFALLRTSMPKQSAHTVGERGE